MAEYLGKQFPKEQSTADKDQGSNFGNLEATHSSLAGSLRREKILTAIDPSCSKLGSGVPNEEHIR